MFGNIDSTPFFGMSIQKSRHKYTQHIYNNPIFECFQVETGFLSGRQAEESASSLAEALKRVARCEEELQDAEVVWCGG